MARRVRISGSNRFAVDESRPALPLRRLLMATQADGDADAVPTTSSSPRASGCRPASGARCEAPTTAPSSAGSPKATPHWSTGRPRPRRRPSSRPIFPSTSGPRRSTAPRELVGERVDDLALTIAAEAGKPLKTARVEAARCVDTLTFSATEARKLTGGTVPMEASSAGAGKLGVMLRVPYGVVGAISPFNFPLNLVAHKLGPAIAAGNAIVLKPAGQTPISALKLAEILLEAGLSAGLAQRHPRPGLRGRQRDRRARADPGAHLHRLRRRRLGHPQPRPAQEGQPGAGVQRAADRPLRRRLGDGG